MNKPYRYLVTGLTGQLVQSLVEEARGDKTIEVIAVGRPELDLSIPATIAPGVRALKPDLIVSAAAYTAVDQAEGDEEAAFAVNADGPAELAKVAQALSIPIIHISTDYVFDGSKTSPYSEGDPVSPLGVYGRSKLAGEQSISANSQNYAILRTAWVYSPFGKNFLRTMLRIAETRDEINVVADQIGNPTSALDIAKAVIDVGRNLLTSDDLRLRGIFHTVAAGEGAWADFATEIFQISRELGGPCAKINKIPSSAYPTPARRPANSRLDSSRLAEFHDIRLPDWRTSTRTVVERLLTRAETK